MVRVRDIMAFVHTCCFYDAYVVVVLYVSGGVMLIRKHKSKENHLVDFLSSAPAGWSAQVIAAIKLEASTHKSATTHAREYPAASRRGV